MMSHPEHFEPLPPAGLLVFGSVPLDDELVFFHNLSYQGLRVWAAGWLLDQSEPILLCEASPRTIDDLSSEYFMRVRERPAARYAEDVLLPDGWSRPDRSVYTKAVHVDALEKVVGPPPSS